jgi:predicted TIM-barrel fold metal-dependent hydrolase
VSTPVIDCHLHVGRVADWGEDLQRLHAPFLATNLLDLALDADGAMTPAGVLRVLDASGVDRAVVLSAGDEQNDRVLAFGRATPRLLPVVSLDPTRPGDHPGRLAAWLDRDGARGLKLYPTYHHFSPDDPALHPLYAVLAARRRPVIFHTGSSVFRHSRLRFGVPLLADDVAVAFPDLPVVLAHAGRPLWYDQAFELARLHPNVHLDLSGLPPRHLLTYLPRLDRIPDQVLFGTDWPSMPSIARSLAALRALPLPEAVRDALLGGNAARVFAIA